MSEVLREGKGIPESSSVPVAVLVAGIAIIATRLLSVLLQIEEAGIEGITSFAYRSAQAWDSTLIFIASQLIFFFELRCAVALMRGKNWARWGFVVAEIVILFYMFCASMGWVYPELFSIKGQNSAQVIPLLMMQKLPDVVLIFLLFVPAHCRQFFRQR